MKVGSHISRDKRLKKKKRLERISSFIALIAALCLIYFWGRNFMEARVGNEASANPKDTVSEITVPDGLQSGSADDENTQAHNNDGENEPSGNGDEDYTEPPKTEGEINRIDRGEPDFGSRDPIVFEPWTYEPKDYNQIKTELESYIKNFEGTYGIYFIDLTDGSEFGINDTEPFVAASTVKVPINLFLFRKIEEGKINPESVMTYQEDDYEGGAGSIQYSEFGTQYTVRELSRLSIVESDNCATNMLIRLVGRRNYKDFMKELGGTVVEYAGNDSCPKDMAIYMKKVHEFSIENPELGGELIGYLENTIFNDRIPKLLPEGTIVAHKTGNLAKVVNDVGIVYGEKPYIISIMSKDVPEGEATDVIANISKKVYDFVYG